MHTGSNRWLTAALGMIPGCRRNQPKTRDQRVRKGISCSVGGSSAGVAVPLLMLTKQLVETIARIDQRVARRIVYGIPSVMWF